MNPTDEQVKEILLRSSKGESVARAIRMMDLPLDDTLEFLKGRQDDLRAAKEIFRQSLKAKRESIR